MKYKVLKFGGSILKDRVDFMIVSEVIESEIREKNIPIPVVSAMKGVTDQIIEAVDSTYRRKPYDLEGFIDRLYSRHLEALPEDFDAPDSIRDEFQQLKHVIEYIKNSGELTDSAYSYAVSRGEKFSCIVLAMHLSARGVENICYPGEDILVTDENYRDALVDLELTGERLLERMGSTLGKGIIPVVAGFSGRSRSGRISTLGRGGSDDTAVCLGYCLGVNDVIKYVDQGGIMTIDPRFLKEIEENYPEFHSMFGGLPEPELIPYLSYVEASELMREERIKFALVLTGAVFMRVFSLTPFIYMVVTSFSVAPDFLSAQSAFMFTLGNYRSVLGVDSLHFVDYLFNSLIVSGISAFFCVLVAGIAARIWRS